MMKNSTTLLILSFSATFVLSLASCSSSTSEDTETSMSEEEVIAEDVVEEAAVGEPIELKPAEFKVESLVVSPVEVVKYEKCTITVDVTNIGETEGTYDVILRLDDEIVDTKQVTLDGGSSESVSFTLSESQSGTYAIDVNGLKSVLTVKQYTAPPEPEPEGDRIIEFLAPYILKPDPCKHILIDFDSDGDLDLIVTQFSWPPPQVPIELVAFRNDGKGNFQYAADAFGGTSVEIVVVGGFAVADFNSDGRDDLFIGAGGQDHEPFPGEPNCLLIQNDAGQLIDESDDRLPSIDAFTHDITAGDIDSDGDIDIYACNVYCQSYLGPCFYINDGSGFFTSSTDMLPSSVTDFDQNMYTSSLLVDIDNDDDLDLVLGRMPFNNDPIKKRDTLLLNDGTGQFNLAPENNLPLRTAEATGGTLCIRSADFNQDGWVDLLMATHAWYDFPLSLQLLMNNGDGTFRDETSMIEQDWEAVAWPDVDGMHSINRMYIFDTNEDSFPDIVAIGAGMMDLLFENSKGESLTIVEDLSKPGERPQMQDPLARYPWIAIPGDLDGDGDMDVIMLYHDTNQKVLLRD